MDLIDPTHPSDPAGPTGPAGSAVVARWIRSVAAPELVPLSIPLMTVRHGNGR